MKAGGDIAPVERLHACHMPFLRTFQLTLPMNIRDYGVPCIAAVQRDRGDVKIAASPAKCADEGRHTGPFWLTSGTRLDRSVKFLQYHET